jgi:putative DNA primase/helicase
MSTENIARGLGLRRSGHEYVGACPSCGYRTGFSVTERDGRLLIYCAAGGCEQPVLRAALAKQGLVRDREERRTPKRRRTVKATPRRGTVTVTTTEQALALWQRTDSANDSPVMRYLIGRGIVDDISISGIRFLLRCKHRSGAVGPAMIGLVEHVDRGPIAVHRTWLLEDGSGKADLDPVKMTLGPIAGGAIRLAPIGPTGVLAVAEGIESALSYMMMTGTPTWSAICAAGLESLVLPPEVREVSIARDSDPRGVKAADRAAQRWLREGRKVSIAKPPAGLDFNDILIARRAA